MRRGGDRSGEASAEKAEVGMEPREGLGGCAGREQAPGQG